MAMGDNALRCFYNTVYLEGAGTEDIDSAILGAVINVLEKQGSSFKTALAKADAMDNSWPDYPSDAYDYLRDNGGDTVRVDTELRKAMELLS